MREMIEPRNEKRREEERERERSRDEKEGTKREKENGFEKQLQGINKKNWFDGRETPNAYVSPVIPPRRIYLKPPRDIENRTIFTLSTANA